MRIGILTLPLHVNYGGILQAWALQTVLERMGHKAEVFGLKSNPVRQYVRMPYVWSARILRRLMGTSNDPVFKEIVDKKRNKLIYKFISDRINTALISGLSSISERRYDAIVVGSDQIWRKKYISCIWRSQNPDEAFLSLLKEPGIDRISYAASLGVDSWDFSLSETVRIKDALSKFKALSVRETSAVEILKRETGFTPVFVLDPTMLLTPDDYISRLGITKKGTKKEVVSYILDPSPETEKLISKVCEAKGLRRSELNRLNRDVARISVEKWVESIANAEIVVTDSFHGCVFSIIFNKPLIFTGNESRGNARFDSLISTFGIKDNCLSDIRDYDPAKSYFLPKEAQVNLEKMRIQSIAYLTDSLTR